MAKRSPRSLAPRRRRSALRAEQRARKREAATGGGTKAAAEETPGRFDRVGAGWKAASGVIATLGTAVGILATLESSAVAGP
jgi:hypothetical protein